MAQDTTISGLPWPELGDEPNIENAVKPLAEALDDKVNVRFSSSAERDAAITAPVAGQECYVTGSGKQVYNGTAWQVIPPVQTFVGTAAGSTDASGFYTVTHGLGFTPNAVMAIVNNASGSFAHVWGIDNIGGTTFRVRFTASNGTSFSGAISITWVAFRSA